MFPHMYGARMAMARGRYENETESNDRSKLKLKTKLSSWPHVANGKRTSSG